MSIFCPRCRTKHTQRKCPLNNISICHICTEEHLTDNCPSLPGLQAIYKSGDVGETSRRPPWKSRYQPAYQIFPPQSPPYYSPYQQPQQWNNPSWQSCHLSILLLNFHSNSIGHKGGEENHILRHNLSLHLVILILSINPISSSICLGLYL